MLMGLQRERELSILCPEQHVLTQSSIAVCYQKIDKGDTLPDTISAGRANPGTTIYISNDSFTRILGFGKEGEVCFAGEQVVRG